MLLTGGAYRTFESHAVSNNGVDVSDSMVSYAESLIAVEGGRAVIVLATPVLLTGLPALVARPKPRRFLSVAGAVALGALIFVSMLSVGMFYLPAFVGLIFAAWAAREPATR